ncbi:MAG TPA: PadR family transcriptional regulator [Gemmatimonadaceae bacterium]|jgi:DNA-binding PadR family transcriptional regulator
MSPRLTYPTGIVLLAVSRGIRYGFEIMDASGLPSGTIYPILRRLEEAGMLNAKWESTSDAHDEQRPPRRYYQITGAGRQALREVSARFPGLVGTLQPSASPAES